MGKQEGRGLPPRGTPAAVAREAEKVLAEVREASWSRAWGRAEASRCPCPAMRRAALTPGGFAVRALPLKEVAMCVMVLVDVLSFLFVPSFCHSPVKQYRHIGKLKILLPFF